MRYLTTLSILLTATVAFGQTSPKENTQQTRHEAGAPVLEEPPKLPTEYYEDSDFKPARKVLGFQGHKFLEVRHGQVEECRVCNAVGHVANCYMEPLKLWM